MQHLSPFKTNFMLGVSEMLDIAVTFELYKKRVIRVQPRLGPPHPYSTPQHSVWATHLHASISHCTATNRAFFTASSVSWISSSATLKTLLRLRRRQRIRISPSLVDRTARNHGTKPRKSPTAPAV